jgi:hypothetical protein
MAMIDWRIVVRTSFVAFVLTHPQYIGSLFIVAIIVQAIVLTWVANKIKNILGPWVSGLAG